MRATPPAALAAVAAASALAFAAGDSYAACLASLEGAWAENLAPALAALPAYVAAHGPVSPGRGPLLAGTVCAVAVWLAWSRAVLAGGNFRQGEEHGSARWLPPVEAARRFSDTRDPDNNIILTRRVGLAVDQSRLKREWRRAKNILVIGGTGSGKTFSYVMPNALQANQDFLITDTKGTLSRDLGGMFAAHGYEVVVFVDQGPIAVRPLQHARLPQDPRGRHRVVQAFTLRDQRRGREGGGGVLDQHDGAPAPLVGELPRVPLPRGGPQPQRARHAAQPRAGERGGRVVREPLRAAHARDRRRDHAR